MSESPDPQAVLRARARALAQVPAAAPAADTQFEVLEFRLAQERYAIETSYVDEVHPLRDLTPLPGTPAFLLGIVNVRGRILPVFDLKKFFELPEVGITDLHRIILVRGYDLELGLLADVVSGVRTLAHDSLQPGMPTLTGIRAQFLKGIAPEGLVVLDLARILSDSTLLIQDDEGALHDNGGEQ